MTTRRSLQPMIERNFTGLIKSQRTTIAALVSGLLHRGRVGLAEIARGMRDHTTPRHRIKRLWRFASNPRIQLPPVFLGLIQWMLSPDRPVVVALDWTTVGEFRLLCANVVVARRAVPLAWRVVRTGEFSEQIKSRNDAEEQVIAFLREALADYSWVLVADRGFARADLFKKLSEWGIRYVIRACGNPWVKTQEYEGPLDSFPRGAGRARRYEKVWYHRRAQVPVNLVVTHEEPAPEPWYLITNVAGVQPVVKWYRQRMAIEESFRDAKTGLGLKCLRLSRADRVERMMILVAIAMWINVLVGLDHDRQWGGKDPQLTTKRRGRTLSMFRRGQEIIWAHGLPPSLPRLRLHQFLEGA